MEKDTLLKIAERIRDNTATTEEKKQFLEALASEFKEVVSILNNVKNK